MAFEHTVYILTTTTKVELSRNLVNITDPWFGTRQFPIPAAGRETEDFLFDLQFNSDLNDKGLSRLRRELRRVQVERNTCTSR